VDQTHRKIFENYVTAGAFRHDAAAVAELFTPDGDYEAPLLPPGHPLPRRMHGRAEIRDGMAAYHRAAAYQGAPDLTRSRLVLHDTTDADVFIAELDTALIGPDGRSTTMSLVQIFRVRDGLIVSLRDYFAPPEDAAQPAR
jgi:ketosteroid isomerase-like protein